jgi:hypothetical protein
LGRRLLCLSLPLLRALLPFLDLVVTAAAAIRLTTQIRELRLLLLASLVTVVVVVVVVVMTDPCAVQGEMGGEDPPPPPNQESNGGGGENKIWNGRGRMGWMGVGGRVPSGSLGGRPITSRGV